MGDKLMPKYVYDGRKPYKIIYKNKEIIMNKGDIVELQEMKLPNKMLKILKNMETEKRLNDIESNIIKNSRSLERIDTNRNSHS